MILTEEEAKTKRCQESFGDSNVSPYGHMYAGAAPPYSPQVAAVAISTSPSMCIGSACMAWRWKNDPLADYPIDTKGYCGKAGRVW